MLYLKPVAVRIYTTTKIVVTKAVPFVYPPTKHKLRRLMHVGGVLVTGALMVELYRLTRHLPWEEAVILTSSPIAILFTKLRAALKWAEEGVDGLPIPEGDGVPVDNNSQLEVTGVHGRGNL